MAVIIARTLLIYLALLVTLRLLGKRQLGEMELSEFILAAMIADLATQPLQDMGIPLINGLLPILVLFCCEVLISGAAMRSPRLRAVLFGRPSLLISRGVIDQKEMARNRFTVDELMQALRAQGECDPSRIACGVLETNGRLSVLLYPAETPATAAQLGLTVADGSCPSLVVSDGRVLDDNLRRLGLDRRWLDRQLKERGAKSAEEVFMMTVNDRGQIYFAAKEGLP